MKTKCFEVLIKKQMTVYVYAESEECAEALVDHEIDYNETDMMEKFEEEEAYVDDGETIECSFEPAGGFFVLNPENEKGGE